jgi:hypothetical protein
MDSHEAYIFWSVLSTCKSSACLFGRSENERKLHLPAVSRQSSLRLYLGKYAVFSQQHLLILKCLPGGDVVGLSASAAGYLNRQAQQIGLRSQHPRQSPRSLCPRQPKSHSANPTLRTFAKSRGRSTASAISTSPLGPLLEGGRCIGVCHTGV